MNHPHSLINRPAASDSVVPNTKTNQTALLRELLLHMLSCCITQCQYPRCRAIKALVRHGLVCKTKGKGCMHCKKMWAIFRLHARNCRDSQCRVPKCRDLRAHDSRKQQQADSRRRAAVKEMVRQRAADASASTSD